MVIQVFFVLTHYPDMCDRYVDQHGLADSHKRQIWIMQRSIESFSFIKWKSKSKSKTEYLLSTSVTVVSCTMSGDRFILNLLLRPKGHGDVYIVCCNLAPFTDKLRPLLQTPPPRRYSGHTDTIHDYN